MEINKWFLLTFSCCFLTFVFCSEFNRNNNGYSRLEKTNSTTGLLEEWSKLEKQNNDQQSPQTPAPSSQTNSQSELRQRNKGGLPSGDNKYTPSDHKSGPSSSAASSSKVQSPSKSQSKKTATNGQSETEPIVCFFTLLFSSVMNLKTLFPSNEIRHAQLPSQSDVTSDSVFFQSTSLIDVLKEMERLFRNKYGGEHEKLIAPKSKAKELLKQFKIKEETKKLFEELKERYFWRSIDRVYLPEIFSAICKQLGKMGNKQKPGNKGNLYNDATAMNVTLGLSQEKAKAFEIGYCHNDVEPNVYIMLGPPRGTEKCFFLAVDFRDDPNTRERLPTRRILEHFYARKDGREERTYEGNNKLYLQKSIDAYKSKRKDVDKENVVLQKPKQYSYVSTGILPKSHTYNPTTKTRSLFRCISQKHQPDIKRENFETLDELCKEIGNFRKFGIHESTEFSGDENIVHKIFLFESVDKREGIRLLGLCKYENKDTIYVYLAAEEEYEREYLLAIRDNVDYTVVVANFHVQLMTDFVHF